MHLIFERSNGRFKSNCNILALAWMPYYNESNFRQTHFNYHQKLLTHWTGPLGANQRPTRENSRSSNSQDSSVNHNGIQEMLRQNNPASESPAPSTSSNMGAGFLRGRPENLASSSRSQRRDTEENDSRDDKELARNLELALRKRRLSNSRLYEQYQRYVYLKFGPSTQKPSKSAQANEILTETKSNTQISNEIDEMFGRQESFGWLAIGNIGKIVGITLTSTVVAPKEIDGRKVKGQSNTQKQQHANNQNVDDLIVLDDSSEPKVKVASKGNVGEGDDHDLAKKVNDSNESSNFEQSRPDKKSSRVNYNLRGHLDEIIQVRWNELYQKLATVDSKGNVLIWSKANEKFTIQTPFYNRSKAVADFRWSNDGKTALICYTDSFILVGGSSGQRHWHSMLNLDDYHITCASWAPNDELLLLGVSNGNVVLIDLPNSELTELVVGDANIRTMCWSSSEMNLRHLDKCDSPTTISTESQRERSSASRLQLDEFQLSSCSPNKSCSSEDDRLDSTSTRKHGSNVVTRRRLSRNCALFCRYRPSSQQPNDQVQHHSPSTLSANNQQNNEERENFGGNKKKVCNSIHKDILAIDFANNTVKLFDGGLNDSKPKNIKVNLESYLMAWSSNGKILAVAGFNVYTSTPSIGYLKCKYLNSIKFYNQTGNLIYTYGMRFTRYPITALTWAHEDQRLFVATGPRLHCAKVFHGIPKLSLLSLSCLYRHTKLMDKADVLKQLLCKRFVSNIYNWQSFNCPLDLEQQSSNANQSPKQKQSNNGESNHQSVVASGSVINTAHKACNPNSDHPNELDDQTLNLSNNINVICYNLPAKLKSKIDQMFQQTLRRPFDEQLTLNDIVWHVPKNQQRHYCTLICYTHEPVDNNQQYRSHQELCGGQKMVGIEDNRNSDQFKIFILYVEIEGSLVPILKARRIGFLKPEFVLFDPEQNPNKYFQRHHKVSDISNPFDRLRLRQQATYLQSPLAKQQSHLINDISSNCSELHVNRDAKSKPDSTLVSNVCNNTMGQALSTNPTLLDPYLIYLLNLSKQRQTLQGKGRHPNMAVSGEIIRAVERYRLLLKANTSEGLIGDRDANGFISLPETSELVRIRSNIWGTKFKVVNVVNRKIGSRARLSSVKYKASLLHLQPRQIHINLKDMSNYCVLCSMHHHTRVVNSSKRHFNEKSSRWNQSSRFFNRNPSSQIVSLIDFPVAELDLKTPMKIPSSKAPSNRRNRLQDDSYKENDKVILAVGDNIRIAPKLEANQKYKFNEFSPRTSSSMKRNRQSKIRAPTEQAKSPQLRLHEEKTVGFAIQETKNSPTSPPPPPPPPRRQISYANRSLTPGTSRASGKNHETTLTSTDGDILTLTLDQGDQVRVEMTSISSGISALSSFGIDPNQQVAADSNQSKINQIKMGHKYENQKMGEFLHANKTLKSIQAITKMIVDLSSQAEIEDIERHLSKSEGIEELPVFNSELNHCDEKTTSPARNYIPPETPVHRPRLFQSSACHQLLKAQSASNTPLRLSSNKFSVHRDNLKCGELERQKVFQQQQKPPPPVPFRRKLSASAKRLFDGSLRSLANIGSGGYSTTEELDSEDCESLVHRRSHKHRHHNERKASKYLLSHTSQPSSPSRNYEGCKLYDLNNKRSNIDLTNLRSSVVQKMRQSTNWMSSSLKSIPTLENHGLDKTKTSYLKEGGQQSINTLSCTKRSRWTHQNNINENPTGLKNSHRWKSHHCSSSTISSSSSSSSSSSDSSLSPDSLLKLKLSYNGDFAFLDHAMRAKLFKKSSMHSMSAKELNISDGKKEILDRFKLDNEKYLGEKSRIKRGKGRKRRATNRSICQASNCCCSREFKLNNRPPVWNEQSQVYQLDFGGRVTQESAKNLQIDFNGMLVSEKFIELCLRAS